MPPLPSVRKTTVLQIMRGGPSRPKVSNSDGSERVKLDDHETALIAAQEANRHAERLTQAEADRDATRKEAGSAREDVRQVAPAWWRPCRPRAADLMHAFGEQRALEVGASNPETKPSTKAKKDADR